MHLHSSIITRPVCLHIFYLAGYKNSILREHAHKRPSDSHPNSYNIG